METLVKLTIVRPPATVTMILDQPESRRPAMPERAADVAEAVRSNLPTHAEHSAKFHEDMRRRYETPLKTAWHHEGINLNEDAD
jgi:hypothetical protein